MPPSDNWPSRVTELQPIESKEIRVHLPIPGETHIKFERARCEAGG